MARQNRFGLLLAALAFGGSVALFGLRELSHFEPKGYSSHWVQDKLQKRHRLTSSQLVNVLHSHDSIETFAKHPELAKRPKRIKGHKDQLSSNDKSSLKKLIDKVTTK